MYFYIQIIHIFCYSDNTYFLASISVDRQNTEIRVKCWADRKNEGRAHMWPISCNTSLACTLVILNETIHCTHFISVYYIQYYDVIIKLSNIRWNGIDVVS